MEIPSLEKFHSEFWLPSVRKAGLYLSPLNVLSHAFTDPSWCCETLTVHHNKAHRMSDRKRHCVGATAKDHPVARSTYPFWVGFT